MLDIEAQKKILSGMKDFYGKREDTATQGKSRRTSRRLSSDWFSGGGRVGLAKGGNKKPFGSMTTKRIFKMAGWFDCSGCGSR